MSNHSLSAENLLATFPQVLQNDPDMAALASSIADILAKRKEEIRRVAIYSRIDDLPEDLLDILAYDFKADWYNPDYPIEVKRALLKSNWSVHRRLGTKWAVENVINTYFGEGYVEEWFQYGGDPGHFRVYSTNPTVNETKFAEFLNLLNKVKRASAKLDGVFITLAGQMNMSAGTALHEIAAEQYDIGAVALV